MATMQTFLAALTNARAVDAGVAATAVDDPATDPNAPDLSELQEASAARARVQAERDEPAPVYEPPRPLTADTVHDVFPAGGKARPYRVPVPAASAAWTSTPDTAGAGLPVQVLPASGGRPRAVTIRNTDTGVVILYTEQAGAANAATPPPGGYTLPAGNVLETTTQGAVYAAGVAAWTVSVWVDTYPAPQAATGQ